jgi:nitrile hydratase subunit alpha
MRIAARTAARVLRIERTGWSGARMRDGASMSEHDHDHDDHDHGHHGHHGIDDPAHPHNAPMTDVQLRVRALESLLTEKGLVDPAALDTLVDTYETKVGPRNGAQVVAKAWTDPTFKRRLLEDAGGTLAELGFIGRQGEDMVVLENTESVHNMVVCTLCSCYPWPVLGLPPVWYKSAPYRSRAVIDPRGVLRDFGVELPEDVEVRVWDSTAELRYLVLPRRPEGTERMTEEELASLVTRDTMIGTGVVRIPESLR